ncbi:MAG TPA: aminoacyl-histidine dipeptidase [Candidatus Polarisedimenticolaceae bacterium]|nr:aminoacyl-histidine dipeptidase [Candidatus Polarisedimenticolaceae bacterium]
MSDSLDRLAPHALWGHFASLAAIPRPSGHEERAVDWVLKTAASVSGAKTSRDARGNVVVTLPGTPGREKAKPVILQSHLDMVCEKNKGVTHDFDRDPIRPRIEGEWVYASGTTLGADNGIGVAAALATATDGSLVHGPLELLFTLDEETGLTGARDLDPSILKGRMLLNLDSEEDGAIFVGCAGGEDSLIDLPVSWTAPAPGAKALKIEITGLKGGHSGLNIIENRGNALKLVGRILAAAGDAGVAFEIASMAGGSKHNAIPREAEATIVLDPGARAVFEKVAQQQLAGFQVELHKIDDGLKLAITDAAMPARVLARADRDRFLRLLLALPHGVLGMSQDIAGLVETSNNVAVVAFGDAAVRIVTSSRSSVAPSLSYVLAGIRSAAALAGGGVTLKDGYPGWKPDMDSQALAVVREVYRKRWGKEPLVTAIHAGLECGLLGQKIPGLDMVSFGPRIEGAHSPDERVHVPSVERFWGALAETLDRLSA